MEPRFIGQSRTNKFKPLSKAHTPTVHLAINSRLYMAVNRSPRGCPGPGWVIRQREQDHRAGQLITRARPWPVVNSPARAGTQLGREVRQRAQITARPGSRSPRADMLSISKATLRAQGRFRFGKSARARRAATRLGSQSPRAESLSCQNFDSSRCFCGQKLSKKEVDLFCP